MSAGPVLNGAEAARIAAEAAGATFLIGIGAGPGARWSARCDEIEGSGATMEAAVAVVVARMARRFVERAAESDHSAISQRRAAELLASMGRSPVAATVVAATVEGVLAGEDSVAEAA